MGLAAGTAVGPYEILAPIDAGGRGEVYRARDPRIGREVAVKILPGAASGEPERQRRFEQEARAAGALNHPNVLAVYDIGAHAGVSYIVSELLTGETLRRRIGGTARCRFARRWTTGCRSLAGWPRRTRRGSCTATSSPRTCS